jgi:hypothetical protein
MEHTKKYLQAKWVTENPNGYDKRDVVDAKRYCNSYLDGYNQALRIHDVAKQNEHFNCLSGNYSKGIKPCEEWCGDDMCQKLYT